MGIKINKSRSQRITSSGYLKKNLESKNRCRFWLFKKKPHKTAEFHENPKKRSQAGFWAIILLLQFGIWVSGPRQTDRRDLGFKTSTDGQTGSGFQDLDRRTDAQIWVSGPRQTDRRDLGFKTSTDR
jgi:hypothetical protein